MSWAECDVPPPDHVPDPPDPVIILEKCSGNSVRLIFHFHTTLIIKEDTFGLCVVPRTSGIKF